MRRSLKTYAPLPPRRAPLSSKQPAAIDALAFLQSRRSNPGAAARALALSPAGPAAAGRLVPTRLPASGRRGLKTSPRLALKRGSRGCQKEVCTFGVPLGATRIPVVSSCHAGVPGRGGSVRPDNCNPRYRGSPRAPSHPAAARQAAKPAHDGVFFSRHVPMANRGFKSFPIEPHVRQEMREMENGGEKSSHNNDSQTRNGPSNFPLATAEAAKTPFFRRKLPRTTMGRSADNALKRI